MTYEWDPAKASASARKHRVSFEEAASIFLDPTALTFSDPDHSAEEDRWMTIGRSARQRVLFVAHIERNDRSDSSARVWRLVGSNDSMKKASTKRRTDDLRAEYDLKSLKGLVRGTYYRRAMTGTNLVVLEPDVARVFPDSEAVNRALRLLRDVATKSSRRTTNGRRRTTRG